jgi:hypothetical protein
MRNSQEKDRGNSLFRKTNKRSMFGLFTIFFWDFITFNITSVVCSKVNVGSNQSEILGMRFSLLLFFEK